MTGIALLIGLALGAALAWVLARTRVARTEVALARLEVTLEEERKAAAEKLAVLEQAKEELATTFKALSSEALHSTLERLQASARDHDERQHKAIELLVAPMKESLQRFDGEIKGLERARSQAYGALITQVRSLGESQERLRLETRNLVTALRAPAVRGRWGELQLRRVVEMAGMLAHCDFVEQHTTTVDERRLRPDLIVKLPGGKNVVVDAKVPLDAYLRALEATEEAERSARLSDHARQIRQHIQKLSVKSYWEQFQPSPEFVVLFIPGEAFYSAALEHDPALIEEAIGERVLVATPTTLIALLKAVAAGWQQETVAQSAHTVSELGREVYGRLSTLGEHLVRLGRKLDGAVNDYNQTIGSLERRVLPAARRLADHGAGGPDELPAPEQVDRVAQKASAPELVEGEAPESVQLAELPRAADAA
jgi:DNA recombination protein RmuC